MINDNGTCCSSSWVPATGHLISKSIVCHRFNRQFPTTRTTKINYVVVNCLISTVDMEPIRKQACFVQNLGVTAVVQAFDRTLAACFLEQASLKSPYFLITCTLNQADLFNSN